MIQVNRKVAQHVASVIALAGAALGATTPASALNISTYNEADPNQVTLYIGGATAHDPGLVKLEQLNAANNGICSTNTLDFFQSADNLKRMAYCSVRDGAVVGIANNTRLAIHKASEGGSGNGVAPVVRPPAALANPVDFWAVPTSGGFLAGCAGTAIAATGPFLQYTTHTGCANTPISNAFAPDAGISDLEPAIFRTAFSPALSTTELNAMPANGISAVVFGVPVTLNLRNNLQQIQFPGSSVCNPTNAAYAANAETEGCQPSLTKAQMAAAYTGAYPDWTFIGNGTGTAADPDGIANANDLTSNGEVFVCRRVGTSGTQASYETFVVSQRCVAGVPEFLTSAGDPTHVSEGSSSTNVVTCMTNANSAGRGAIGVISLEFAPTIGGGSDSGFRFIKLGGSAPCLLDIVRSKYEFVAESTMQWRTTAIAGLAALTGDKLDLANAIRSRFGNTAVVVDLNSAFVHPMCAARGSGALLGNALTGVPAAPPFVAGGGGASDVVANPVMTKTRGLNGPKACAAWIDVSPTEATP